MNSIQQKIWLLVAVVMFFMAAIWTALTYYNQRTQHQYNEILQRYLQLHEAASASQKIIVDMNNYLLASTEANKASLDRSKAGILEARNGVMELRNAQNDFTLTSYVNLIDSLVETTDRSLLLHEEQDTVAATQVFTEATSISNYISEMSLTLLDTELKTYERFYRDIIAQSEAFNRLGIWALLLITCLLLLFTYWFSSGITRPVKKLTQAANRLSKGRFDLKIEVDSKDEIAYLAQMFDRMRININNLIQEIQEKAQLEKELQQNRLLLQESRLLSLQSQINPHFLFNTLDTLSKKAYLEGAEETSDLLVNVAGLLRYNLKRLDRSVTLYDEVNVLRQYVQIQRTRFTDRLRFHTEIDERCLYVQIPGLTLQPIVENAVIHAIEPMEEGGTIRFRVRDGTERIVIEIEDDGPGMTEEKIKQILEEKTVPSEGHSTGIGFGNVVKRLRLFYGLEDVIDIQSPGSGGTKVILKIPKARSAESHDQSLDRR